MGDYDENFFEQPNQFLTSFSNSDTQRCEQQQTLSQLDINIRDFYGNARGILRLPTVFQMSTGCFYSTKDMLTLLASLNYTYLLKIQNTTFSGRFMIVQSGFVFLTEQELNDKEVIPMLVPPF
ncbi:hypothetical protein KM1_318440 [Entamoeba histolytica HM-3:IMSS]|uniref:Uncharacterized protein n=4 Tax=Entamoeba histolytica TaxID=5759 RepID=C4M2M0_ENTH1|nr:hypothetical protein EHI_080000 [Entamoeba histolytica HM-1:IMSS]EAL47485.1 hypothetical protein EHI_080000 [Entamoeba histolytica HM-1:IMSS]EMD44505.1 Hypothetical protein EHI5A_269560 [Entamoeba histolytica KU27]EMS14912.1 hypothetical protein KM1_318440 [Entamoeba histolytica HM-3:IMSS]GAT95527.1 hypothetical protein CL6EHI_080000 [Entamoeba histolytica]|eukprot:XP_652871.1 hypothetical protein EHI_080000 [Entamoeba histolytica HM-1:IMSS]